MKKQTKIIVIFSILIVIAIIFIYPRLDRYMSSGEDPAPASSAGSGQSQELPVKVVEIRPEKLENILSITGTVLPNEAVSLRPEIFGLVERVAFKEGEFVRRGTPLVYLNDDELSAQYQRLEYSKKLFESQENRQKQLLEREAISQEEYDISLNQFNTNLSDLKLVEAQLRKTVIRAPFDGVLGLRQISEGSVIGTADVIANVVSLDPIKIQFSIPERYANEVEVGSKIFFSSEEGGTEVQGVVYAFEPTIDPATRTLQLRAESPNKEGRFLPGMFVRIRYILGTKENAFMVPSEAIIPELNGYKVFVVNNENKIEEKKIAIGTRTDKMVEIVDGVNEGDLVLTTGVLQARIGMSANYTKIN
jgi:membrane fusion protein (multidrug efflux system)